MPKVNDIRQIDLPYDPSLRRGSGRSTSSGGGGGGGGSITYLPGDGIAIDVLNTISVIVEAAGAITFGGANGLQVNVGPGLKLDSNAIAIDLATDPGLELTGDKLRIKTHYGLELSSNGVGILLEGTSGLVVSTGGLSVGAGDGIDVLTSSIAVDVTDIIDTMYGLTEDANNIRVKIATTSGLTFDGSGFLTLGAPSTLTYATTNSLSGSNHAHAVTASYDVGTTPAASILRSDVSGQLTLAELTIKGNLIFNGSTREIQATNDLRIVPDNDLILDPVGFVLLDDAQEVRTATQNDFVAGIYGVRQWDTGGNLHQLNISKIKADELHVRVFSADENRVQRGATFWARSFGIVETGFTVPADEATVDVWFEEAPDLGTFGLFIPNNWILFRTLDVTTGLIVQAVWFQVVDGDGAGTNNYLAREDEVEGDDTTPTVVSRQQWRLRRKSGGFTGEKVKKGNVGVEFGLPLDAVTTLYPGQHKGQGVVHLSALHEDGGPFLQIQTFDTVTADVPQFLNRVRMGNLNGTVDYGTDIYGLAAGNDLSKTPSTGFSGFAAEGTDGLRMFNTDIELYDGSTLGILLTQADGLSILQDTAAGAHTYRYINWFDDLDPVGNVVSFINSFDTTGANLRTLALGTISKTAAGQTAHLRLSAEQISPGNISDILVDSDGVIDISSDDVRILSPTTLIGVNLSAFATSTLHVYENTSNTGATAGVTIEQDSTGDARLNWLLTGGVTYSMGIDNSVSGDPLIISANAALGTSNILSMSASGTMVQATTPNSDNNIGLSIYDAHNRSTGSRLHLHSASSGTTVADGYAMIFAHPTAYLWNYEAGSILFGTNSTEVGAVSSAGDWGLGTSPVASIRLAISDGAGRIRMDSTTNDASVGFVLAALGASGTQRIGGFYWKAHETAANSYFGVSADNSTFQLAVLETGYVGIGTTTPGVNIISTTDLAPGNLLHIDSSTTSHILIQGASRAALDLVCDGGAADEKWFRISNAGSGVVFRHIADGGVTNVGPSLMIGSGSSDGVSVGGVAASNAEFQATATSKTAIATSIIGTTAWPTFVGRRARGVIGGETQVLAGDVLATFAGLGYTSGGWATAQSAEMLIVAYDNFSAGTTGERPGYFRWFCTADGSSSRTVRMELLHDGALVVPYIWSTAVAGTAVHINSNGILTKTTSSIRFKENVRDLPNSYGDDFIMAMRPVMYNATNGTNRSDQIGLIAEEVQAIAGGAGEPFISRNDDGLVESLHYERLVAPTVGAVQRLIADRAESRAKIWDLEARIAELERRLN